MQSLVKTRNLIIVILSITIICMGVGFAVLSMELENKTNNAPRFSVEYIKAETRTPVQGGAKAPTATSSIINSGQTINIEFNLSAPHDEIGYKVIIKNTGNIPAEIVNLLEKEDYTTDPVAQKNIFPIKITHNDINGKILEPGDEVELNIIAMFDYKSPPEEKKVPYQLSIITRSFDKEV